MLGLVAEPSGEMRHVKSESNLQRCLNDQSPHVTTKLIHHTSPSSSASSASAFLRNALQTSSQRYTRSQNSLLLSTNHNKTRSPGSSKLGSVQRLWGGTRTSSGKPLKPEEPDYLHQAAECISSAQKSEVDGYYDQAFCLYKAAVNLLIKGVQDEKDVDRLNIVRKKTAKYLLKAERVYRKFLNNDIADDDHHHYHVDLETQSLHDSTMLLFLGRQADLRTLNCCSVIGRLQVVCDPTTDCLSVIKFLPKTSYPERMSSGKRKLLIPMNVPFMVILLKVYLTDVSVVLQLQYHRRGRLWDCLNQYFNHCRERYFVSLKRDSLRKSSTTTSRPVSLHKAAILNHSIKRSLDRDLRGSISSTASSTRTDEPSEDSDSDISPFREFTMDISEQCPARATICRRCSSDSCLVEATVSSASSASLCADLELESTADPAGIKISVQECTPGPSSHTASFRFTDLSLSESELPTVAATECCSTSSTIPSRTPVNLTRSASAEEWDSATKPGTGPGCPEPVTGIGALDQSSIFGFSAQDCANDSDASCASSSTEESALRFLKKWSLSSAEDGCPLGIPEWVLRIWTAQLITAICCLHAEGLIWRDLQPKNILLGDDGQLLLTFFCQWPDVDIGTTSLECSDALFMAPELLGGSKIVSEAADFWSVGVILWELLTGVPLNWFFPAGFTTHSILEFPVYCQYSEEAKDFVSKLIVFNPRERLGSGINGFDDLRKHPFLATVPWKDLETLTMLQGSL